MNRVSSLLLVLVFSVVLALSGGALGADPAGREITVTGRAAGTSEAAGEEARLDALRVAVSRVCGSFINAQSETEDFALVRDKVLEQPVGFARVVKVLAGPSINQGITEIQLVAEVFPARFEKRWVEFAHIKQREGNPRCVIVVVEDDDPNDANPPVTNGLVQTSLEDFFLEQDVRLMDQGVSDAVRNRDLQLAAIQGDVAKLASAGAAFKADVVILGTAEAKKGEPVFFAGQRVNRWTITLVVRAIESDSGAILMSKSYQPRQGFRSTNGTSKDALGALGREMAPEVLSDIGKAWRKRATVSRMIQVTFEPCSRKTFKAIQVAMSQSKGIVGGKDGFALRELVNDIAQVEVNWKYNLNQLADRMEELKMEADGATVSLEVTEQSANRLTIRVIEE